MKKIFAILLMVLMISSFNTRIEAADITSKPVKIDTVSQNSTEEGKITLKFLQQINSWQELVNTVNPMGDYSKIENHEDFCCVIFIETINKEAISEPIYHDMKYVNRGLYMELKNLDYDRLMQKYQTIVDIYNTSYNTLQIDWISEILSENFFHVHINSTNIYDLTHPATKIGQSVILKAGTKFWESSYNDGSGKQGTMKEESVVIVNGVAYLDENWTNVVESYYNPYDELKEKEIDTSRRRILHVCTEDTDLGCVYSENAIIVE